MSPNYYNNLAFEEIGEDNDEIILFLHSKLLSNWIWIKQKEDYEKYFKNYHCIFLDLPHHGKSIYDGEFSIDKSSETIIEFLESLKKSKTNESKCPTKISINIVALGLGGLIAIDILNKNPLLIKHLIISGVEIAEKREIKENSMINILPIAKAKYLNEKPDKFITKAYLRYFGIKKEYYDFLDENLDIRIRKEMEISYESFNFTLDKNLREEAKQKKNILFIYGNKEDLTCAKSAIILNFIYKNSRLLEINNGNHLWNIINYDLFNRTIINFIKEDNIEMDEKLKIIV